MIRNTVILAMVAGCCVCAKAAERVATASSPDGRNQIRLYLEPLAYDVLRDGQVLVAPSEIGMTVDGVLLAGKGAAPKVKTGTVSGIEKSPVYKKGTVNLERNETFVDFGKWGVRLAARNDGVAYRFETTMPGRIRVDGEKAYVTIPEASAVCQVNFTDAFGCEETVTETLAAKDVVTGGKGKKVAYLPVVCSVRGKTLAITESDVFDYPIWNFERADATAVPVVFQSVFAGWPKRTERVGGWGGKPEDHGLKEGGRWLKVLEHDGYLVETDGTRPFPWRTFVLADKPAQLCEADLVYALARPATSGSEFSWVKPGKVAWDWWNDWHLEGVPFKAGCNTKSYEYYIDFAARTGVEYVIFDEGWSEALNIWKFHPDVDVPHLIDYANKKGVGIILWMAWAQIYGKEDLVASHFAKLGAKGFKVDFMDRGDAEAERFLWKFADACARNQMLVDYHGVHRPTGMSRAYPNVLNYEGIHGLEQMKFYKGQDILGNDVRSFFGRLTAGPMDYTPGAMLNYPVGRYTGDWKHPGSMGTRSRQMAMMTLCEAPLQMLCDSPTRYEKNMECFRFMAAVPVVWDDTVGLGGTPETFAAVARRKGEVWYAAGISSAAAHDFELDTGFLGAGNWSAEIFRDAPDSVAEPTKFVRETRSVRAGDRILFRMAPGGGFTVRFTKQ